MISLLAGIWFITRIKSTYEFIRNVCVFIEMEQSNENRNTCSFLRNI